MRAHDRIVLVRETAQKTGAAVVLRVAPDGMRVAGNLDAKAGDSEAGGAGPAYTQHSCALIGGSVMLMIATVGARAFDLTSVANRPGTNTPQAQVSLQDRKREQRRFGKVPAGRLAIDLYAADAALYLPST